MRVVAWLVLLGFFFVPFVQSAELLVKAKAHWMDSFNQTAIDKMSEDDSRSYEARSQIGDIIVVKPNEWKWGKSERLPQYVVIKIPDLKFEDAKKYEDTILDEEGQILKIRKYQIPKTIIDDAKAQLKNSISVKKEQKDTFVATIIDKSK